MTLDEELNRRIGRLLKEARRSGGVMQEEMAEAAGLSKNHLSEIERGLCRCGVPVLLAYCDRLGMTPDEILGTGAATDVDPELLSGLSAMSPSRQGDVLSLLRLVGWL